MSKIVTLEQAKKLKDIRYREDTIHQYKYNDIGRLMELGSSERMYNIGEEWNAPSISEALQWIREKYQIVCGVGVIACCKYPYYGVYIDSNNQEVVLEPKEKHPEAESSLLDALIEYVSK